MRVGPNLPQNMNMNMNMPRQNQKPRVMQNQQQNNNDHARTPAMAMAQKILNEQGEAQAGHFLYAIRPFVAPAELVFIEQRLNIQSKRDPALDAPRPDGGGSKTQQKGGMDMQMMQMLMGLMNNSGSNSKFDPMMLLKLMNGAGK